MGVSDLSASLLLTAQVNPASPWGSVLPIPSCRQGVSPLPPQQCLFIEYKRCLY